MKEIVIDIIEVDQEVHIDVDKYKLGITQQEQLQQQKQKLTY